MKKLVLLFLVIVGLLFYNLRFSFNNDPLKDYVDSELQILDRQVNQQLHRSYYQVSELNVPCKVAFLLNHSKIDSVYIQSVIKLYLKIYYYQFYFHGQSFELRDRPFLLSRWSNSGSLNRAFLNITQENLFDQWYGPEYIDASEVMSFLEKRPDLIMSNQEIKKTYKSILELQDARN